MIKDQQPEVVLLIAGFCQFKGATPAKYCPSPLICLKNCVFPVGAAPRRAAGKRRYDKEMHPEG